MALPEKYRLEPLLELPDLASMAIAGPIALDTSRASARSALQDQLDLKLGFIDASITQYKKTQQNYWAEISVEKGHGPLFGLGGPSHAPLQTRLAIVIIEGEFEGVRLCGTVQEDLFRKGVEMCCHLVLRGNKRLPSTGSYKIDIQFAPNSTTCDRQVASLMELGIGIQRGQGVDLPALVLKSVPTVTKPNALYMEIKGNKGARAAYRKVLEGFSLDSEQLKAAELSLKSPSGALIMWGPPGSGKTMASLAMILAHIKMGHMEEVQRRPILVCAPSNAAVDNMARRFRDMISIRDNIQMCRFKGEHVGSAPNNANALYEKACRRPFRREELLESGDPKEDATWDMLEAFEGDNYKDQDLVQYHFQNARGDYIREVEKNRSHAWSGNAHFYLEQKKKLKHKTTAADEKKRLRAELEPQEELWDMRFLQACDIVLCTNNTAAHPLLTSFFRPAILLSDEAPLAALPDAATPMAAHKESLLHVILTGDQMQQAPQVLSKGSSELRSDFRFSLFEQLQDDSAMGEKMMLTTQYRMKDAHSRMVSDIWYEGKLIDHPSLDKKSNLAVTIEAGLKGLGKSWNGRLRLAVDVSGPDVFESNHQNSNSLCNHAEATLVVDHVEWLLKLWAPCQTLHSKPGRNIREEDILVISPYSGQVALIRTMLAQRRINRMVHNQVRAVEVRTSASAEGAERDIVLFSWVVNRPGKPLALGFTKDSKQMCVNFSRVKEYQVSFGNWAAWTEADVGGGFADREDLQAFAKVVRHHRIMGDVVDGHHFGALLPAQTHARRHGIPY